MIRIGEGSTTADRHETRVAVFREDHIQYPFCSHLPNMYIAGSSISMPFSCLSESAWVADSLLETDQPAVPEQWRFHFSVFRPPTDSRPGKAQAGGKEVASSFLSYCLSEARTRVRWQYEYRTHAQAPHLRPSGRSQDESPLMDAIQSRGGKEVATSERRWQLHFNNIS